MNLNGKLTLFDNVIHVLYNYLKDLISIEVVLGLKSQFNSHENSGTIF